ALNGSGIDEYYWALNNRTIIYLKDTNGDMNWHLYGVDVNSGEVRDHTPHKGVQARFPVMTPKLPDELLIHLNLRNKGFNDVYRLNLRTGDMKLDTENPGDVVAYCADANLQVRLAVVITPDGGTEFRVRNDVKSNWNSLLKVGPEANLEFVSFTATG